jgi:TM2 domain-containing membrane protein YozV
MAVFCTKCGTQNDDYSQICVQCQAPLPTLGGYQPIQPPAPMYGSGQQDLQRLGADKKIVVGICAILLGGFGVHKFILGYTNEGIIQLVLGLCFGIGGIIGIIEGIIYLTKSDEEFARTYLIEKKPWF